jgi:hypothetical protein
MTAKTQRSRNPKSREAVVYIGHREAVIVADDGTGSESVEIIERAPSESEAVFDIRAVEEVEDEDRVVVSGPAFARTQFERTYVAMTRRPDRLVDLEPTTRRKARNAR